MRELPWLRPAPPAWADKVVTLTGQTRVIDIIWEGPFAWPGFEGEASLPPLPSAPGVYIQAFEHQGGYLIYAAGITKRPFPVRFQEHTLRYLNGDLQRVGRRSCVPW